MPHTYRSQGFHFSFFLSDSLFLLSFLQNSPLRASYQQSDVDLFIVGLDARRSSLKAIEICQALRKAGAHKFVAAFWLHLLAFDRAVLVKTKNTITIDTRASLAAEADYPNLAQAASHFEERDSDVIMDAEPKEASTMDHQTPFSHLPGLQLQIISRAYSSLEHVLVGFDIPACCVGYDGKHVYALKCFHRAVTTGVNLALSVKRSPSYENRLAKYATRGFAVDVPELDHKRVASDLDAQGISVLRSV